MSQLHSCIKKDRLEIIRKKKNLICFLVLVFYLAMVLLATGFMPVLLDKVMSVTDIEILSEDSSLTDFMNRFFPDSLRESMGIYASDIGTFYSALVICLTFNLLPGEIRTGKMILPICAGYNKNTFFLSKEITYGLFCSLPVVPFYLLYYFIASSFLKINYEFKFALINAFILMFAELIIACTTISLSVIYKRRFLVLASMVALVVIAPDLLTLFSFNRFFPTYLLTYVYKSSYDVNLIWIPIVISIIVVLLLNLIVIKKKFSIDVDERR